MTWKHQGKYKNYTIGAFRVSGLGFGVWVWGLGLRVWRGLEVTAQPSPRSFYTVVDMNRLVLHRAVL